MNDYERRSLMSDWRKCRNDLQKAMRPLEQSASRQALLVAKHQRAIQQHKDVLVMEALNKLKPLL